MAQSFSSAKVISGLVLKAINRRGFSAAASTAAMKTHNSASMIKKMGLGEEIVGSTNVKVSWVPDPRTGFYRPENVAEEIDPVELRAMLLKKH